MIVFVSPEAVQAILADFTRHARRVGARNANGRETWLFRVDQQAYALHFYPDDAGTSRKSASREAAHEFTQLQTLQKLTIPATRVVAQLKGFRLGGRKGDACIVVLDPADVRLDEQLRQTPSSDHAARLQQMAALMTLLEQLHREQQCPTPLRARDFSMRGDRMLLSDGSIKLAGLVDVDRLAELDQSTRHLTTAADRLRVWRHFSDAPVSRREWPLRRLAHRLVVEARLGENDFGTFEQDGWIGRFLRRSPFTLPWSNASTTLFDASIWTTTLDRLIASLDRKTRSAADEVLKDDPAATIVATRLPMDGQALNVVVKRPFAKRGLLQSFRRSRAMRSWLKTWKMLGLGFACELPLMIMERRKGATVEQMLVMERVSGPTLAAAKLSGLSAVDRERLMYAAGRTLRRIEAAGFTHSDAKSSNWIVWTDRDGRARPILIDLDGIRRVGSRGVGVARLLRALRTHPEHTDADLAAIQRGYRP